MALRNHRKIAFLLAIFVTIPPNSSQTIEIDEFNTVFGTCIYSYNSQNVYSCNLSNARILNPTDVLNIIGSHLPGHTDADVHEVIFESSTVTFFNGEVLRKFTNLRRIQIIDQGLREFGASAFDFCPNLVDLLSALDSQLTSLPPQMLRNCHNLQHFIMIAHNLTAIPVDLFGATTNLREFNVGNNRLTSFPENLLQNMVNLRAFSAASNLLTNISPNLLRNAHNLEVFSVADNRFDDQQAIVNILNNRPTLRRIYIDDNNFPNFDFQFFSQFQNLEELTIGSRSGPTLSEISWQSLPQSLTMLRVISINENISGNAFSHLVNMHSLTLGGLGITSLHRDTFSTMTRMQFLTIQNTNIRTLHPELFINQVNLINLNLNNNQIGELSAGVFAPLVNIGGGVVLGIRLASNNLQRLNADAFGQHPQLRYIDFSQNQINEIERGIFSRFSSSIDFAGFRSNVCINWTFFSGVDLDNDDRLTSCFNNHAGITTPKPPTTTPAATTTTDVSIEESTTPDGSESNFRRFEVFFIILIGFFVTLYVE